MPSHGLRLRIFQRQFRSRFTLPLVWSLKDPLTLVDLEFYCQVIWSSCHHGCFIFHETTWVMPDIAPSLLMLPFTLLLQTFCVSWFLVQEKPELDNELACKRNVLLHPSPFGDFQALLYLLITFLLQRSGGFFEVQNSAAVATRRRKKRRWWWWRTKREGSQTKAVWCLCIVPLQFLMRFRFYGHFSVSIKVSRYLTRLRPGWSLSNNASLMPGWSWVSSL